MGCFSYICPVCGKNIRGGEKCVLIHKREGVEVGRTEGHYDEYGGVIEDGTFRKGIGLNSHEEICASEFGLTSSFHFGSIRVLPNGKLLDSYSVHAIVLAYVDANGYEIIRQDPTMTEFADSQMQEARKRAEVILKVFNKTTTEEELGNVTLSIFREMVGIGIEQKFFKVALEWAETLPKWDGATSGIIAVHNKCYRTLDAQSCNTLPFSDPDPEQGCGRPRQIYL